MDKVQWWVVYLAFWLNIRGQQDGIYNLKKKRLKSNYKTRCFSANESLSYCKYSTMFIALLLTFQFQAHDDRSAQL